MDVRILTKLDVSEYQKILDTYFSVAVLIRMWRGKTAPKVESEKSYLILNHFCFLRSSISNKS